jgi:hypothetical protein
MVMRKRLGFIACLLLAFAAGPLLAAPPTEQQVRQLMDVIGLGKSLSQMNTQIVASMKQALPCVASNYWQDFIDQSGSREFIGRLVPVYQKHFTADDVQGLIKFYSSPLGQKVLSQMPAAMAEANQAGQQWSDQHQRDMLAKMEQAGTLGANGRCPASVTVESPAAAAALPAADEAPPVKSVIHGRVSVAHKHARAKKKLPVHKRHTKSTAKAKVTTRHPASQPPSGPGPAVSGKGS